jgi:hypothetical protein
VFQRKKKEKSPETDLNEMEISSLLNRGFKTASNKVRLKMHEQNKKSNKERENIKITKHKSYICRIQLLK